MYKIALVCQHGASTGMCTKKMIEAAKKKNIECEIAAYSDSQIENLVLEKDCILLGPQLGFKKTSFQKQFPEFAKKIEVINAMDFGMMNGEAILNKAIALIETDN